MNLLYFTQKELHAAWLEATRPLFPDNPANDYVDAELFKYYQSRKGKIIDTKSGESLFSVATNSACSINAGHLRINKTRQAQSRSLSGASSPTGFLAKDWKTA